MNFQYLPRAAGGAFVRATFRADPRRRCAPRRETSFTDVTIPGLTHPPGSKRYGANGGGSLDAFHSATLIEIDMKPAALADHYSDQMIASGWSRVGHMDKDTVGTAVRFSTTTVSGTPLTALLVITPVGPRGTTRDDLFLRVMRHGGRPDPRDPPDLYRRFGAQERGVFRL